MGTHTVISGLAQTRSSRKREMLRNAVSLQWLQVRHIHDVFVHVVASTVLWLEQMKRGRQTKHGQFIDLSNSSATEDDGGTEAQRPGQREDHRKTGNDRRVESITRCRRRRSIFFSPRNCCLPSSTFCHAIPPIESSPPLTATTTEPLFQNVVSPIQMLRLVQLSCVIVA